MEKQITAEERLKEVEKRLDEYESSNGVNFKHNSQVDKYLNLSSEDLRGLSLNELGEGLVLLSIFAGHIRKLLNRETSTVNWCNSVINSTIAGDLNNYKAYGFQEKQLCAIKGNEYASKLDQLKRQAQLRVDRLNYLASDVQFIGKSIQSYLDVRKNERFRTN